MRAAFGFVSILVVLGVGYYIYTTQLESGPAGETLPQQTNLIAVRQGLMALGQSERLYMATHGRYATLEQLRSSGIATNFPDARRWGYEYTVDVNGAGGFLLTARPVDPGRDLPTMTLDETMQIANR